MSSVIGVPRDREAALTGAPPPRPRRIPTARAVRAAGVLMAVLACGPARSDGATPSSTRSAPTPPPRSESDRAVRELRLALQENPLDAGAHHRLALWLARQGDLEQAMVGFRQALAIDPNHAAARYNLGSALLQRGEAVTAAGQLEDALTIRPDHAPTYNNLAKAYFLAGLPELAVAGYAEALRLEPHNGIARRNLALLTGSSESPSTRRPEPAPATPISTAPTPSRDLPTPPPTEPDPLRPSVPDDANALPDDPEVRALREWVRDLPHVTVERRDGHLTLAGWTTGTAERKLLDRILAGRKNVADLTTEDIGDPHRLIEVDATIFKILGYDSQSAGHNFLRRISVNASISDGALAAFNWLYTAALSYEVNIANVSEQRVAFLARPHLTTLSGSTAAFVAGGDIVYQVAGLNSGDIKPYPFGTTLDVTPTLLRSRGPDDGPRIRLTVKAGRRTLLPLEDVEGTAGEQATVFENISVASEAVLGLNQTLILTGLNQREQRSRRSGVPGLKSIPVIKYLFSEKVTSTADLAIVVLLTPRDPAYWDEENRKATAAFVEKRRAYVQASQGTDEDLRRFRERYPDWAQPAPNRLASHFFLTSHSEVYRRVSGVDLANENLDFQLLEDPSRQKKGR